MPPAHRFGAPHRHYRAIDSTNERARALAAAGAPGGTIVTADAQTKGRGRRGRTWAAPPGKALLYSAIVRSLRGDHALLPIAAPVAVCEAIERVAPVRCQIKWPNDVWIDGRKVAGILIESRVPEWAVIGVGVNVAIAPRELPPDLRWPAASVGHGVAVAELRSALDEALGAWVGAERAEAVDAYRQRDALAGRRVRWEEGQVQSGTAEEIDEEGNLLVLVGDRRIALGAGEVTLDLG